MARSPPAPPPGILDTVASELLADLARRCEAQPDREVCGFLVHRDGRVFVEQISNAADRYHAAEPQHFPRSSRTSYLMDPREQLELYRRLDAEGGHIAVVWHSHVETGGAFFSAKDREDAVVDGVPVVPGADHLVLGLRGGQVAEVRRFRWNGVTYIEVPLVPS
jgi:[CysO sulfur-carrier protein]-S-L-cysteine hydrolase